MTVPREERPRPRILRRSVRHKQTKFAFLISASFTSVCVVCVFTCVSQLFEEVSRENSQLQSQLQDTQRIVTQTRLDLEKATQVTTQTHRFYASP